MLKPEPTASGAILAGGASRRMGRDKLGLKVGERTLVARVYDVLRSSCDDIVMVGSTRIQRLKLGTSMSVRTVPDLRPGRAGPLAGIEAALAAARHDLVFVAAGDMPFIPKELAGSLLELLGQGDARVVVPRHGGRLHPLCAAYHREVLADLSFTLNLGVRAVHTFLDNIEGVRYVEEELALFGDPEQFLMNVNSPEDLERARRFSETDSPQGR
ncbi:MAG: molybdenum cofactor guanylyltransferase [Rubrobacteraceae bacterium]